MVKVSPARVQQVSGPQHLGLVEAAVGKDELDVLVPDQHTTHYNTH